MAPNVKPDRTRFSSSITKSLWKLSHAADLVGTAMQRLNCPRMNRRLIEPSGTRLRASAPARAADDDVAVRDFASDSADGLRSSRLHQSLTQPELAASADRTEAETAQPGGTRGAASSGLDGGGLRSAKPSTPDAGERDRKWRAPEPSAGAGAAAAPTGALRLGSSSVAAAGPRTSGKLTVRVESTLPAERRCTVRAPTGSPVSRRANSEYSHRPTSVRLGAQA